MKIKNNMIYHLPTQELEEKFLIQAEKQGVKWAGGHRATERSYWEACEDDYCISIQNNIALCGDLFFYRTDLDYKEMPIVKWSPEFTKDDMEDGMLFINRGGGLFTWSNELGNDYNDDLTHKAFCTPFYRQHDIVKVYPKEPLWERKPKTYRVKQELTEEQAKKLGLEFCEVVG